MAFLEDAERSFEAALSFVDEFALDEAAPAVESAPGPHLQAQRDVKARHSSDDRVRNGASASVVTAVSDEERKRLETNARHKMLRKAGVYANPNRARNERRREIACLREQVQKLQIDLSVLKQRTGQTQKKRRPQIKADALVSLGNATLMAQMWKELAERQQRRRRDSERENVRLKLAVDHQRKLADSLTSLIQKRARQLESECSPFTSHLNATHHVVVHALDLCGDRGEFQKLFRRLQTFYEQVDAVLAANGLGSTVLSPSDVHIQEADGGKCLELFANKVLPFTFQDVREATWDHFRGSEKHWGNGSLYEKAAKDLDEPYTILEDFTKEVYSHNARADIRITQVLRRYVEADRDLVVWASRGRPVSIKHKLLRGLTYNVKGFVLSKRSPASTCESEVSQLQSCTLVSFTQDSEILQHAENLRGLSNFLAFFSAQNMRAHQRRIENILVDRVLEQRVHGG